MAHGFLSRTFMGGVLPMTWGFGPQHPQVVVVPIVIQDVLRPGSASPLFGRRQQPRTPGPGLLVIVCPPEPVALEEQSTAAVVAPLGGFLNLTSGEAARVQTPSEAFFFTPSLGPVSLSNLPSIVIEVPSEAALVVPADGVAKTSQAPKPTVRASSKSDLGVPAAGTVSRAGGPRISAGTPSTASSPGPAPGISKLRKPT